MNVAIIIPALRPGPHLTDLVEQLSSTPVRAILIIDDGSGPDSQDIFDQCAAHPQVRILRHAANLGKGAAIKSGMREVVSSLPDCLGVVTADADGQHDPEDILRIAQALERNPQALVLGARQFDASVPAPNRIGNILTRLLVRFVLGQSLRDTQTGLRGIPRKLLPFLLELRSNGYEFELDMLIACKHHDCRIVEEPIQTIYHPGNPTSHFDPLRDSMKISFVLFRFTSLSLLTTVVDNVVFYLVYSSISNILISQAAGRLVAVLFNYGLARRAVFLSHQKHRTVFPRYILLVVCSGAASYGLIRLLTHELGINAMLAKVSAELLLFIANFALQRDFVFTKKRDGATDWTHYYRSVPVTARLTRKYTSRVLISALKRFRLRGDAGQVIVELGGANSCFLDRIVSELRPSTYHIIDSNEYGLELLRDRESASEIRLHRQDVLKLELQLEADTVFSVGLIEHFDPQDTRRVILKHFDLLKPEGCAILSFPTPTWLYRSARAVTELFGLWKFPDERPLSRREVIQCIPAGGEVVLEKTLWPLVFTQHMMVIRKPAR